MLLRKPLENLGDLLGAIYDFEKTGDLLPKHIHDERSNHITIVARGKIKVYSHDWEIEGEAGTVWDFKPNEPHEFMALEDNSRIVNILKKMDGIINDYTPAPEEPKILDESAAVKVEIPEVEMHITYL
jgi:hypothetical protein